MNRIAVSLAALLQLLGSTVFFSQPEDQCSPAPSLASWLFLVATLCFLWDANVYPYRFRHMARGWQFLIEIVAAIFLVEMGSIIVWCSLERCLFFLMELFLTAVGSQSCKYSPLVHWLLGWVTGSHCHKTSWLVYLLSGLVTSSASCSVLWYILQATDGMYYVAKVLWNVSRNIRLAWRLMRCYLAMNMAGRLRTVQVCQLAASRRGLPSSSSSCSSWDEDEDDDDDQDSEGDGCD